MAPTLQDVARHEPAPTSSLPERFAPIARRRRLGERSRLRARGRPAAPPRRAPAVAERGGEAQEARPALQRWFDKFSSRYATGSISLSFIFALALPWLSSVPYLGNEGSIYRSLAFLIAASPCALPNSSSTDVGLTSLSFELCFPGFCVFLCVVAPWAACRSAAAGPLSARRTRGSSSGFSPKSTPSPRWNRNTRR